MARKFDLTKPNLTKKLARFADVARFPNCVEVPNAYDIPDFELKGHWAEKHFKNDRPIVLELACGKGEYTVGQAQLHPDRNFIGIDIKGNRIWKGAKRALGLELPNAAFLRTRIDHLTNLFSPGEVEQIWILFPDPQPQKNRRRKRLTSPIFLDRYRQLLGPEGIVHLKTDSTFFYEFTHEVIAEQGLSIISQTDDLYADLDSGNAPWLNEHGQELRIRTFYESMWLEEGKKIKYVAFRL